METPNDDATVKKTAASVADAYAEQYLAAYGKLEAAVAAINAALTQSVAGAKESLAASQAEIAARRKQNDAADAAAGKRRAAAEAAAEKALAACREVLTKRTAELEAARKEAQAAAKKRTAADADAQQAAMKKADAKKAAKADAAAKKNTEIKNEATIALETERKRSTAVVKNRAAANKRIEDAYAQKTAALKAACDKDIAALEDKIASAQKKYLADVAAKKQAYEASCAAKKAAFDAKKAELDKKAQSADKLVMKEGQKGLVVAQKEYDRDAKAAAAAFDAELAALKAQFVASVPPVEHDIFVRKNKYKIDCLAAENAHSKETDNSAYEEYAENQTNALNTEKCGADHEIALANQKHVEFCDAADFALAEAAVRHASALFAAEEECRQSETSLNDALAVRRADLDMRKGELDSAHAKALAAIAEECAKAGGAADVRYAQLASELNALGGSFAAYYAALNEFDGTSAAELASLNASMVSACGDAALSEDKARALYGALVGIYNRDCEKQETGVLDQKIAQLKACAEDAQRLARERYDREKAALKADEERRTAAENADHAAKLAALESELKDCENKTAADIAAAQSRRQAAIAAADAALKDFEANDAKTRAASEREKQAFAQNKDAAHKKLTEDARAREAARLADCRSRAAALDAKLAELKNAVESEKKGENVMHAKLTEKTIKVLLKGCEIRPGERWWVVDFNK